eukprot:CAMPEP_0180163836 /NCGR_PEP_ID=MMETSP0986-20121125/30028_1 /TAXON_ID=697907 /ORGANISM="non described non described, Strain CCMP2293" /LENGTH=229 /DNA_ID=CAMNT_0022114531 /DNA_START=25 /DNA_END=714 /DNA_ORIENTATION=+
MTKLYIGNLSFNTGDEELRDFFTQFGSIEDAVVIMDRDDPGRSRGFGFVTYATAEEAATAVAGADGQDLQGRALRVNVAEEKSRGDMGGGRGGPGGGPAAADQTLECRDCSAEFIFSGRDQRYYASQGFSNPIRCTECKIKVKEAKSKPRERKERPAGAVGAADGPDEMIECRDCKEEFPFTAGQQKFHASKGFSNPTRCAECKAKKGKRGSGGGAPADAVAALSLAAE